MTAAKKPTSGAWGLMINMQDELEERFDSLSRALEFFDKAMSQPDSCGTHRDAIDWLHESATELRDAHWAHKMSKVKP